MTDHISNLQAVITAMDRELSEPYYEGRDAVLAACVLFVAVNTRPAEKQQQLIDRRWNDIS